MELEILSAINFLTYLITINSNKKVLNQSQLFIYRTTLKQLLTNRYINCWNILNPYENSNFRSIIISNNLDTSIKEAAIIANIDLHHITKLYPKKLHLYIDPNEVTYQINSAPYITTLYERHINTKPWSPYNKQQKISICDRNKFCLLSKNNVSYYTEHYNSCIKFKNKNGNHVSVEELARFVIN